MYSQNIATDEDKHKKRTDLQREIIMTEGELRKFSSEKSSIEMEIRKLRKESDQIRIDTQQHQEKLKRIDQDVRVKTDEVSHLKKQLNLV